MLYLLPPHPNPHPLMPFAGSIVAPALSPIDTSGYIPGEGQICCRIKLIYQMIEYEAKANLFGGGGKMQRGLPPLRVAMSRE